MSHEASGETVSSAVSTLGNTALVVSPSVLADLPALAEMSWILYPDPSRACDPVDTMRGALENGSLQAIDTLLILADGDPLIQSHESGAVYRAIDFVNTVGDNPLIGTHPSRHESFFIDMADPFHSVPEARFESVSSSFIHDCVLGIWPSESVRDQAETESLQSLGADFMSSFGVNEAVAARATGKHCMALFYARGDREGARTLLSILVEWGILSPDSSNFSR